MKRILLLITILFLAFPVAAETQRLENIYKGLQEQRRFEPPAQELEPEQEVRRLRNNLLELQLENSQLRAENRELQSSTDTSRQEQLELEHAEHETQLFVIRVHQLLQGVKMIDILLVEDQETTLDILLSIRQELFDSLIALGFSKDFILRAPLPENESATRDILVEAGAIDG